VIGLGKVSLDRACRNHVKVVQVLNVEGCDTVHIGSLIDAREGESVFGDHCS
jgi:hypothetical protein